MQAAFAVQSNLFHLYYYTVPPKQVNLDHENQYHCQDKKAGFALFFRRHESGFSSLEGINVNRIRPDQEYLVSIIGEEYVENSHKKRMSGKRLMETTITIKDKPGSALLEYQQL